MRRITALVLVTLLSVSMLAGCQQKNTPQGQSPNKKSITIPSVTVDLQSPENCVDVPADEPSVVYDADGNQLTDGQWLLNSKFAKSYIRQLGAGSYTFRYESDTAIGSIELTITDSQAPDYLFYGDIPETVNYLSSLTLPQLVKNQDSYQDDYPVTYTLKKGEEPMVLINGFETPSLTEGNYTWTASVIKDDKTYDFTKSFYVQSIHEYLSAKENEFLMNNQTGEYVLAQNGSYTLDTTANVGDYYYSVSQEVLDVAQTGGMKAVTFAITVDKPLMGGAEGSIWISNNWNGYVFGVQGSTPALDDRSDPSWPNRFIVSVATENGQYIYKCTVFLDRITFTEAQPLTLQFNFAKCLADVTVEFQ